MLKSNHNNVIYYIKFCFNITHLIYKEYKKYNI